MTIKAIQIVWFLCLLRMLWDTVYPKKYAHGFCFAVLCCGYTLTDFPISIRLTSLALWQSNDCPSACKATLMNMDKYFMWINNERLHNHNKAKHNTTVCIFLGINCIYLQPRNRSTTSATHVAKTSRTIKCIGSQWVTLSCMNQTQLSCHQGQAYQNVNYLPM